MARHAVTQLYESDVFLRAKAGGSLPSVDYPATCRVRYKSANAKDKTA
jgi:hypothetical protein